MNSKIRMRYTSQKGITLIALVITIIVLLILAGVTINMVLGDDGIIAQAQDATKANEDATIEDATEIAKGEATLNSYISQTPMTKEELEALKDDENNQIFDFGENEYTNTVAKVVDGVPIPVGFAYVEGTKKDTGLIVVDGYGNEYVWVPVDGKNVKLEIVDYNMGADGAAGVATGEDGKLGELDSSKMENITSGEDYENEYKAMVKSVGIYGGFYVGRYETSWTGSRVASVGNKDAMSDSTTIDGAKADWYTFYNKQKELHANSASVVSGMIYGSQWDAIMEWMKEVVNPFAVDKTVTDKYILDSTGMGYFLLEVDKTVQAKTGSNSAYRVKNIYDLAGNYSEFTQEKGHFEMPSGTIGSYRMIRGGFSEERLSGPSESSL